MSSPVDSILWQLVSEVEPTPTQKDGAQRSHKYLRDLLNSGQMGSRITNSYLSGSYARDTAIRPLDDVDVVFEIVPTAWTSGAATLLYGSPSPEKVLESFANAIRYRYPVSSVYGQRRSVRLELYHLDIDVVPAIPDRGDPVIVLVPDRETGTWIKSSPRRHSENAARVNKIHDGRFKPLVKLLKYWNSNLPETIRCKSFMIETMALLLFEKVALNSLQVGAITFWDFLASRYGEPTLYNWSQNYGMEFGFWKVSVPDAAGTGSNIAAHLDNKRARGLSIKARISRDRLSAAARSRTAVGLQDYLYDAFRA